MTLPGVASPPRVAVPSSSHMSHSIPVVNRIVKICFGMVIEPCIFAVTFCGTWPLLQRNRQQ